MSKRAVFEVAGADGCKKGWVVAVVSAGRGGARSGRKWTYKVEKIWVSGRFEEVLSKTSRCRLVCVDIPIGLSDGPARECDRLARRILGRGRASSVFTPPVRSCLSANEYKAADAINRRRSGRGLSKQSFFIMGKIREVDEVMTRAVQNRVREIHPEVSFRALNGQKSMRHNKKTAAGWLYRLKLLQRVFAGMERIPIRPRERGAGLDDILDALVAAWTAVQVCIGKAGTLPENPKRDGKGLKMEIVEPAGS